MFIGFLIFMTLISHFSFTVVTEKSKIKSENNNLIKNKSEKLAFRSSIKLNSKIKETLSFKKEEDQEKYESQYNLNTGYSAIWKGWVKYFYYEQDKKFSGPLDFFVNNHYFKQRVLKTRLLSKGHLPDEESNSENNNLYINIPSKFNFFATLTPFYLQISGTRKNPLTTKLESLNIETIDPLHKTDNEKTGLKEIGTFTEGKCFDLSTHKLKSYTKNFLPAPGEFKDSTAVHWIICLEDGSSYKQLVDLLTSLLEDKEKARNRENISQDGTDFKKKIEEGDIERYKGYDANEKLDGYLVRINDWTQCTLKCGGGFSYQQWKCIPPKEGGKPCMGELIRKKKCNEQPCPVIGTSKGISSHSQIKVEVVKENPIIKSQSVSNRPQQNIDCVIREEDVLHSYVEKDGTKTALPSRLILNNKSISLFTDIDEKKGIFSYDLRNTEFKPILNENCCYFIRNENHEFKICGMSKCKDFVKSWFNSIDLFRGKCYNLLDSQPEDPLKDNPPKDPSLGGIDGLAMSMEISEDLAKAKSNAIKSKLDKQLSAKVDNSLASTQKEALSVINREIDIEDLIRKEEMIKTQQNLQLKMQEFKNEEKKKKKLEEAFEKQQEGQEQVVNKIKNEQNIKNIKDKALEEIEERREKLKNKIQNIRKLAERRSRIIQNKINIVRNEMSKQILIATKNGSTEKCKNSWGDEVKMNEYCDSNVVDDIAKNVECKLKENFCFACCDSEFGVTHSDSKTSCYNYCLEKETIKGDWVKKDMIATIK